VQHFTALSELLKQRLIQYRQAEAQ
jgi:hypothetical protein